MPKTSGLGASLFLDGVDLSGDIGAVNSIAGMVNPLDVTGINSNAIERIPGLRSGSISFNAWFNPTTVTQEHANLSTRPTTDRLVTVSLPTSALGDQAASMTAKQINYDGQRAQDGSLAWVVECQSTGGIPLEWGVALTPGKRTDSAATNPTSGLDDLGGSPTSTNFGATMYVHLFAFSGTSVTFTLRDAATEPTYAAVTGGATTAMTAIGSQRVATSATQAIRRYLSVGTSGTFSNAVFYVAVTRHLTLSL